MNVGGVATLVLNLMRGLPEHGVEVVLATGAVQEGELEIDGVPAEAVRVPGLGRSPRPGDDLRALRAVRSLVRRLRPDIVHTHTAKAGALGRLGVEGLSARRVHTFHGHLLRGYFGPRMTRGVVLAEGILASRTDLLISSGGRVGAELRTAGVGRNRPWVDIPPGVTSPTCLGAREPRTVALVGRLVPVKRVDRLIEAARLLPDVRFLVAGDGPQREALQSGAPENVEFLGWVTDPGVVYSRAQAVVLCSENEAMPLALIEGALCGLPGITTDAGSAAEVVQHGVTGLVVDGSSEALADAVGALLADEQRRARMGRAAEQVARERYTVDAMCRAHALTYASVCSP